MVRGHSLKIHAGFVLQFRPKFYLLFMLARLNKVRPILMSCQVMLVRFPLSYIFTTNFS